MKTQIIATGLLLLLLGLQGCSTIGSGDFACPGRPEGVRCASAVEVYALTENTDRMEKTSEKALGDDPKKAAKARRKQARGEEREAGPVGAQDRKPRAAPPEPRPGNNGGGRQLQVSGGSANILPLAHRPVPVRTPAQVMRVWIAPWETVKGVLHVGGYHFVEIQARRWTFGGQEEAKPVRLLSIQEPYSETTTAGGERQPGKPEKALVGMNEKRKGKRPLPQDLKHTRSTK